MDQKPGINTGWQFALEIITEWKKTAHFLLVLIVVFPFLMTGYFIMESRGYFVTPIYSEMEERAKEHKNTELIHAKQTLVLTQLSEGFDRYVKLLSSHDHRSRAKDEIIGYLLLEDCEGDSHTEARKKRCLRLEKFLDQTLMMSDVKHEK